MSRVSTRAGTYVATIPTATQNRHVATIAIQVGYFAIIATQNGYVATIATQVGYVATIATQNGYVATLHDRRNLRDFARPKTDMLRLCATQKRYLATIAIQKGYVFARLSPTQKKTFCDLGATQKRYVAILREQNVLRGSPGLISFDREAQAWMKRGKKTREFGKNYRKLLFFENYLTAVEV